MYWFEAVVVILMVTIHEYHEFLLVRILMAVLLLDSMVHFINVMRVAYTHNIVFGIAELKRLRSILRPYNNLALSALDQVRLVIAATAVLIIFQALVFDYWLLIIPLFLVSLTMIAATKHMPPFVLVLAVSDPKAIHLAKKIEKRIYPLAMKELLQVEDKSAHADLLRYSTSSRIINEAIDWKLLIECYCITSKIIVLDIRQISPHVMEELSILDGHNLWNKVIILSEKGRRSKQETAIRLGRAIPDNVMIFDEPAELEMHVSERSKTLIKSRAAVIDFERGREAQ